MSSPIALITGATGDIGFRVLAQVLSGSYRARITSRSLSSAERLRTLPSISPYTFDLATVEIPGPFAPGAFDTAVLDAAYIIHFASPILNGTISGTTSSHDPARDFINPAIHATLGLLASAAKTASVKPIVITSSVTILAPDFL